MRIIILLLVLFPTYVLGQEEPMEEKSWAQKKFEPTKDTRAHFLYFSFGYNYAPNNKTFNTKGKEFRIGVNLARLFTQKVFVGVYWGQSVINLWSDQNFSNQFVDDFNAGFEESYVSVEDSLSSLTLRNGINRVDGFYSSGNQSSSLGVVISPFPDRYGGMAFIYSRINYSFSFRGKFRRSLYPSSYDESNTPNFYNVIGHKFELSAKPYLFFHTEPFGFVTDEHYRFKDIYKFIMLSCFVEVLDLSNSSFYKSPLNNYVGQPFIDKYSKDIHFGFKLSLSLGF